MSINKDAENLHYSCSVVDLHCDTLLELVEGKRSLAGQGMTGHVDLTRLITGNIKVQFFAAFIQEVYKPERSLKRVLQLIETFYREVEGCGEQVVVGLSYRQIAREIKNNRLVAILAVEGGEAIAGDLSVLRILYRLGVRALSLTWNQRNELADGVWERNTGGGLTGFGREVVMEMNRLGMLIDLAHIAEAGFWDVLRLSGAPLMVSHANCQTVCPHPRNLRDDQIKALSAHGGIMGLTFAPEFISPGEAGLEQFLDHIDHIAGLVGTGCIGIGSDFDGIGEVPAGLTDATKFINITQGLLDRGYTEEEIRGIMGGNALRLLQKVLK